MVFIQHAYMYSIHCILNQFVWLVQIQYRIVQTEMRKKHTHTILMYAAYTSETNLKWKLQNRKNDQEYSTKVKIGSKFQVQFI